MAGRRSQGHDEQGAANFVLVHGALPLVQEAQRRERQAGRGGEGAEPAAPPQGGQHVPLLEGAALDVAAARQVGPRARAGHGADFQQEQQPLRGERGHGHVGPREAGRGAKGHVAREPHASHREVVVVCHQRRVAARTAVARLAYEFHAREEEEHANAEARLQARHVTRPIARH